jgi:hypothetical protein
LDRKFPGVRAQPRELEQLLKALVQQPQQSLAELQAQFPAERADYIELALLWLTKLGVLSCTAPTGAPPAR